VWPFSFLHQIQHPPTSQQKKQFMRTIGSRVWGVSPPPP
jgi:hypothetical protein